MQGDNASPQFGPTRAGKGRVGEGQPFLLEPELRVNLVKIRGSPSVFETLPSDLVMVPGGLHDPDKGVGRGTDSRGRMSEAICDFQGPADRRIFVNADQESPEKSADLRSDPSSFLGT